MRFRPAPVVAFALCALAVPALAGDIFVNTSGRPEPVRDAQVPPTEDQYEKSTWTVVEDNLDKVLYRIEGVPGLQERKTDTVRAIYFDPSMVSPDLVRGRGEAERGNAAAARDAFARVGKDDVEAWQKAEAAYRLALTWLDEGNFAEAEKALAGFKTAFPKSKWVTAANEARARALLAQDKVDDAKKELEEVRRTGDEAAKTQAEYYLIWIDEQVATKRNDPKLQGDVVKAYEAFIQRLAGKSAFEGTLRRAQAGRAGMLIHLGRAADAKAELEKLIKDTKDPRSLATLYNRLGLATWRADPTNKVTLRAALHHFLRVVTIYDVNGADEDVAEAGFHAGELFRELKDQGPDWMARARNEWQQVIARFPSSEWARQSKQAMVSR